MQENETENLTENFANLTIDISILDNYKLGKLSVRFPLFFKVKWFWLDLIKCTSCT